MKKLIFKSTILSVVAVIGFLAACKKDSDPTIGSPLVDSFTPSGGGPVSTYVTITGLFFSSADNTTVTIGGAKATILTVDQASITALVPAGATTGKITVTVAGRTGSSAKDFPVTSGTPNPKIIKIDPNTGLGADGSTVKIQGYNFSPTANLNKVEFFVAKVIDQVGPPEVSHNVTVVGTVTAASATELSVNVPAGARTGKVVVSVLSAPGGSVVASGTSGDDFSVPKPVISSITPSYSIAGANVVIMGPAIVNPGDTGSNFAKLAANNVVKFNGVPATVVSVLVNDKSVPIGLVVTAPASTTGKVTVTVDGQDGSGPDFVYPVSVTGVTSAPVAPATVGLPITSASVGTDVVITGNNFSPSADGNSVKFFDGVSAKVKAATNTTITVTVPAGAKTGKISVQVGSSPEVKTATDFTIN